MGHMIVCYGKQPQLPLPVALALPTVQSLHDSLPLPKVIVSIE